MSGLPAGPQDIGCSGEGDRRRMAYKYQQIRDQVIAQAMRAPGNRVPSEHEICRQFGVSRTTAIKALNSLAADRLVRREVGRGTFLVRRRVNTAIRLLVNGLDTHFSRVAARLVAAFADANPDVDVQVDPVDSTRWIREIITRPGMKVLCASHVGYLSEVGVLQPLHGLPGFAATTRRLLDGQIAWRRQPGGETVCDSLPLMLCPEMLAINRGLAGQLGLDADRGPADWGELAGWLARARRQVRHGQPAMGAAIVPGNRLPMSWLLTANGGRHVIHDDGTTVSFDGAAVASWLELFRRLHREGAMPLYPAGRIDPVLPGNALASLWASTWVIGQQRVLAPDERIAILPIPPPVRGGPSCSEVGGAEVAVVRSLAASDRELDAAWRLVRFLAADPAAQRLLVDDFTSLSVLRDVHEQQRADPRFAPFVAALAGGIRRCDHPLQHPLLRIMHTCFHRCVLGDLAVARAAARIGEACALQLEIAQG